MNWNVKHSLGLFLILSIISLFFDFNLVMFNLSHSQLSDFWFLFLVNLPLVIFVILLIQVRIQKKDLSLKKTFNKFEKINLIFTLLSIVPGLGLLTGIVAIILGLIGIFSRKNIFGFFNIILTYIFWAIQVLILYFIY
ncbi:MAG TPA: hypothetical protein HA283_04675 [Nanoarchaeota archaeon]|nr:hypothetical protein [Nanoarchaeota archaeon]HIH63562.1 hypothetical protein [Nanoarchaeota archaeon]HIJ09339.1 hypothetical protein [Nanoarchaeota archaeon]